jgi:hypothetical protein
MCFCIGIFRSKPKEPEVVSIIHRVKMAEDETSSVNLPSEYQREPAQDLWNRFFRLRESGKPESEKSESVNNPSHRPKATLGILSDKETDEVPGTFHARICANVTVMILTISRNGAIALFES